MSESPDGTYVVTSSRAGLRYHRPTCKRLTESSAVVGDVLTYLKAETPAACCKPSPSELARQRAARLPEPEQAAKRPPASPAGRAQANAAKAVAENAGRVQAINEQEAAADARVAAILQAAERPAVIEATAREVAPAPAGPQPAPAAIPAPWVRNANPGPCPPLNANQAAIPLRSGIHATCVADATDKVDGAHVAGQWLVFDVAAVAEVMGALTDWARGRDKHVGMAVAVWAQLRRRHPDATDSRTGTVAQAITALNDAIADGRLFDWQPRMRSDESLDLWLVPEHGATPERMRAGQALAWCAANHAKAS